MPFTHPCQSAKCPQSFSLAPKLCSATFFEYCLTLGRLPFQRFLRVGQDKAQAARVLQEVQLDEAVPREDRPRQQCVSSDFVVND